MNAHEFVLSTLFEMLQAGVTVKLHPTSFVDDDEFIMAGQFDPVNKVFECSMEGDDWIEAYVHEYCHFTQWVDGTLTEDNDLDVYQSWLTGTEHSDDDVAHSIKAAQLLEADNERRTTKILAEHNLCDIGKYMQRSNAYVHYYNCIKKWRLWDNGNHILSVSQIIDRMPSTFIYSDAEFLSTPEWFYSLVEEHIINKKEEE